MDGGRDLAVEYRPIEALIPYARNARTHSAAQVALIAGSIREYGFTNPVLVDGTNGIIAGHGRVMAARQATLHDLARRIVQDTSPSIPVEEAGLVIGVIDRQAALDILFGASP